MSTLTILRKLGVYVDEQFWSAEFCRKLCEEIRAAPGKPAKVINAAGEKRVDEEVRNTLAKKVSAETSRAVTESLLALKPRLEVHFGMQLNELEPPSFLSYGPGQFFKAHTDRTMKPAENNTRVETQRRVSIVLFLNQGYPTRESGEYEGGELVLYGLIKTLGWESQGFRISGQRGLLVAFGADLLHEVVPVTRGERSTIVSWLG